jgi:nucleoside-diphosphate-sugar epimerase
LSPALVVVAGGAGYLGGALVRHLLGAGRRVRVLDRCFFGAAVLEACRADAARLELVKVDSRDATAEHFRGAQAAVDLAGLSNDPSCMLDPALTRSINVEGGKRLLAAARAAGVRRYVYQSSCSVYGSGGDNFLFEDSRLAPVSAYAESKIEMERAALDAAGPAFEVTVSRMATVFGRAPRMRFDLIINVMTLAAVQTGRIFVLGGGQQWRPIIHVDDGARALRLLLDAPAEVVNGKVFNTGSTAHNYRVGRIARLVAGEVGGTELIPVPEDADPRSYRVDFLRAQEALGFECEISPAEGVRDVAAGLRDETIDAGLRSKTVAFYKYLLEAKRVLDEVQLDGRLL